MIEKQSEQKNAVVVGGSIAGLMAAIAIRNAGYAVTVLERTPESEFQDRGSGLGLKPEIVDFFEQYNTTGGDLQTYLGTSKSHVLNRDGSVAHTFSYPAKTKVSSWNALVSSLRTLFDTAAAGSGEFIFGAKVTGIEKDAASEEEKVNVVYTRDDTEHELKAVDLVVGADGASSTVRKLMMGEVPRTYAGYAFQRGRVAASAVSKSTIDLNDDATVVQTNPGCSTISYFLPTEGGGMPDLMLGYYAHYSPDELKNQLLGADGHQYALTLPMGQLRPEAFKHINEQGNKHLSPPMHELLKASKRENIIIQGITDLRAGQNCFMGGKVVIVSEAAAILRPHAFAGTSQAAYHALRLADLAKGIISADEWSRDCLEYSRILQEGSSELGGILLGENAMQGLECWQTQFKVLGRMNGECQKLRSKLGTSA